MTEKLNPQDLDRVRQWRERAEEFRAAAESMHTPVKSKMLDLASDWDRMADNLEARISEEGKRRKP